MNIPAGRFLICGVLAVTVSSLLVGCSSEATDYADRDSAECAAFQAYPEAEGSTVTVYGSIRDTEADLLEQGWAQFTRCTRIAVEYEGNGEFEAQLRVRVQGGNPPDLALIPQPGLLADFARQGKLKAAPATTTTEANQNWSKEWINYGSVDGRFYAAPLGSNVKSFVWYSPGYFKEKGYPVPTTWAEMTDLSDRIAASGTLPWCAGIESGEATGWPATDWLEDVLLRTAGVDVYDQWVNHQIPFNDPQVIAAMERAGSILRNDRYVNGGFGGVRSIATTAFQDAGRPILDRKCAMHRQASFYSANWPDDVKVGPDQDVFAFYFPPIDASRGKPVLGAAEFTAAFEDRPEVQSFQTYLASADFANRRAKLGSWVSANRGLDLANVPNPIDKLSVQTLQDPQTVFRFDGSDVMPAAVGAGTFWKGMTDWINGKDTKAVADYIEGSWPK